MKTYAVIYQPGPGWLPGKPVFEQPLNAHWDYLNTLYHQGLLIEGGPYSDDSGGVVLLRAGDLDEAWEIVDLDPSIVDGVFIAEVHPWFQVDWSNYGK